MKNEGVRVSVLCGVAALALAASGVLMAQNGPVEFRAVVSGTHIVPEGGSLPGLHVDARVKGQMLDIYIAPMYFVTKYDVKVAKGEEAEFTGTQSGDIVLAREITTGVVSPKDGKWRPNMTIYVRNDAGPLW